MYPVFFSFFCGPAFWLLMVVVFVAVELATMAMVSIWFVAGAVVALLVSPTMLLDVIVILVLGLLIQLKQSRVCAVLLLAYSLFNTVVSIVTTGSVGGWLLIIAGAYAVKSTFALEKEYQAFRAGQ